MRADPAETYPVPGRRRGWWIPLTIFLMLATWASAEVEIRVTGTGFMQNRRLARALERLQPDPSAQYLDANGVEDAAFFLFSSLTEEGYLRPEISAELTRSDGEIFTHQFDRDLMELLPRPLEITQAHFTVDRGVRYHFDQLSARGDLSVLDEEEIIATVLPPGGGLFGRGERAYSPSALNRGLGRVVDALNMRGYARAQAEAPVIHVDDETGDVDVTVEVRPGPLWQVASLHTEGDRPPDVVWPNLANQVNVPWTVSWEQDVMQSLRQAFFAQGYPDVQIRASRNPGLLMNGVLPMAVTMTIRSGPKVTVGPVRFEGRHNVNENVLQRRVRARPGDLLDPLEFESARFRLSRLGAFRSVRLHFDPEDGAERSPVFTLTPLPEWELHLLAGYGSYEQLRGGFEVRRNNMLRRGHQARLEAVQSFRSSRGELTYTVPELFGEMIDGTVQLFGLRRDEPAFLREEYGGTVGLRRRRLPLVQADGTISYTYQSLRNRRNALTTRDVDLSETIAASIEIGLTRDRRDNPLRPQRGYRWFTQTEVASPLLGGDAEYQRQEFGISYHTGWGSRRWVHASLTHGVVLTLGAENDLALPVNRRFYPGGDSSIRGYQLGEAAPRGADGRFVGAKTTTLLNVEFEQALIGQLTGVIFLDTLGMSTELSGYPVDEYLMSLGIGLRYQTIIGPLRVEYGHNLRRRELDPNGTLHFSLGFPF
jgi:outer membrane protein insertion porin family